MKYGIRNLMVSTWLSLIYIFLNDFYLFLERAEAKERGEGMRKRNIEGLLLAHPQLGTRPTTQACALTGN